MHSIKEQLVALMLEQPFERIMEMMAQEEITLHYDPKMGDYYCKYSIPNGYSETAHQKKIKLAAAHALVGCLTEQA